MQYLHRGKNLIRNFNQLYVYRPSVNHVQVQVSKDVLVFYRFTSHIPIVFFKLFFPLFLFFFFSYISYRKKMYVNHTILVKKQLKRDESLRVNGSVHLVSGGLKQMLRSTTLLRCTLYCPCNDGSFEKYSNQRKCCLKLFVEKC